MNSMPMPEQAARQFLKQLKAAADPVRAAGMQRYFKAYDDAEFYGLATPQVKAMVNEFFPQMRGAWTLAEAVSLCDLLIREKHFEAKLVGMLVLTRFKKQFTPELLPIIKGWLKQDYCNNWAATDGLCSYVLTRLVERHPQLTTQLKTWTKDKNLWVRRASIVGQLALTKQRQYHDDIYETAELLLNYPEDLMHKGVGWALREAGQVDSQRLEAFLLRHGSRIPRTTVRYAIEHFPEAKRKQLLQQTKSGNQKR